MLKRIYADNFRALVNFELRPEQLNLFLGDNGSGKSTVFNVLGALSDLIVRGRPCSHLFGGTRTKADTRDVQRFELDIEGNGGAYCYVLEVEHPALPERPVLRSETITFDGQPLYRFSDREVQLYKDDFSVGSVFPFGRDVSFLPNIDPTGAKQVTKLAWFRAFMGRISIIQPNPFDMDAFSQNDQAFLMRHGKNLASFFGYLNTEHPEVRTEFEDHLREVFEDFQNLRFRPVGDAKFLLASFLDPNKPPVAGWRSVHPSQTMGRPFELSELSEGQRVLMVLYAAVCGLLRDGAVLCFDEPDNFVSLPEIQPWLQTLREALVERGGQAMIISHHPEAIDYLGSDNVLRFERPSGVVVARPIAVVDDDSGLKLSEILARGG